MTPIRCWCQVPRTNPWLDLLYIYILGIYDICNIFSPLAGEHDDHENDREHQLGEFLDAVASGAPYLK